MRIYIEVEGGCVANVVVESPHGESAVHEVVLVDHDQTDDENEIVRVFSPDLVAEDEKRALMFFDYVTRALIAGALNPTAEIQPS